MRGGKGSEPQVLNAVRPRSTGASKVRGQGKPKAFAASVRPASSSLPRNLCKLSKAAVNMSLQGSTSGDEGGNHHTSVVSLAIVKGRIQHDGRDNGGRLSGEAMRKAQDAVAEVVVLAADAAPKRSIGELAAMLRQVATVLEGDESAPDGGATVVRIVQHDHGLPQVETLDGRAQTWTYGRLLASETRASCRMQRPTRANWTAERTSTSSPYWNQRTALVLTATLAIQGRSATALSTASTHPPFRRGVRKRTRTRAITKHCSR